LTIRELKLEINSNKAGIYCIINLVSGKRYVGQARNLKTRWYTHIRRLEGKVHHNRHLQQSWSKYGLQNFIFEVLQFCDVGQLMANEQFWINYFESWKRDKGYNIERFVVEKKVVAEETKRKMRIAKQGMYSGADNPNFGNGDKIRGAKNPNFGKHRSEETKKKISEARKGKNCGEENPFYGKCHTEETKKKIGDKMKKRLENKEKHPLFGKHHTEESKEKMSVAKIVLSDQEHLEILQKYNSGEYSQKALAVEYKVSESCIRLALQRIKRS